MPVRRLACAALVAGLAAVPAAAATTAQYDFTGLADGATPIASVTIDANGTIYGETLQGADICPNEPPHLLGCGTLFKLTPAGQLTTLVTFSGPNGAGGSGKPTLVGNTLYGVTNDGGSGGEGTIFSVHTDGTGFALLHQFSATGIDGIYPTGALIQAPGGGFYGICEYAGSGPAIAGTLYKIAADGTFAVLHDFTNTTDGAEPNALLIDASGTLYGSTFGGGTASGTNAYGVVYRYVPSTGAFTVLHAFNGQSDGRLPILGSIGANGVLYGATAGNSSSRGGTLFTLAPSGSAYGLTTIHDFPVGDVPGSGPTLAPNGALIGTTSSGTTQGSAGSLYYFDAKTFTTLLTLPPAPGGGTTNQAAQPTLGPAGTIYGTTAQAGTSPCINSAGNQIQGGCGLVYTYAPRTR